MVAAPEPDEVTSEPSRLAVQHRPGAGRVWLAGIGFDTVTEDQVVRHVVGEIQHDHGGRIVTPNIDICWKAGRDAAQRALVARASLVVPDGMPLLWAARLRGEPLAERITGASLIYSLTEAAAGHSWPVFLLGGLPGVAELAGQRLRDRYPGLAAAGGYSPPVSFDPAAADIDVIRQRLSAVSPKIVFVGLGFPKQEILIERLQPVLPGAWFVGCGSAIPFTAGVLPRAPRWAQQAGLEWAFRLACEPRRLMRRYLVQDLPFAAAFLAASVGERIRARRLPLPAGGLAQPFDQPFVERPEVLG